MFGSNLIHDLTRVLLTVRQMGQAARARGLAPHPLWASLLALLLGAAGCKLDEKAPHPGGLILAVDTDMSMPKDIDELQLEVTQSGGLLLQHDQALAEGVDALPLEFQVPSGHDSSPVSIRAIALKEGVARIERSVITTVPSSYLGYVHLGLSYLCDGMVTAESESSCGAELTCVLGSCQSATVTGMLPEYFKSASQASGALTSECFDVAMCLSMATEMTPDPTTCSFEMSQPDLAPQLNVALRMELGAAGVCTQNACWIVLDADSEGFGVVDGRVMLPKSICDQRAGGANLRIAVSTQCVSKLQSQSLCRDPAQTPGLTDPGSPIAVGMSMVTPVGDACAGGATRACAMCGNQMRMCQGGLWSEFSACIDQGLCEPNAIESCGAGGMRSCGGDCTWGSCENQPCEGPATRACGKCGTQHRSCSNGMWGQWSACSDEGECTPETTDACGTGGTRACGGNCQWGPCSTEVCGGAGSGACGNCGTRTRTCDVATRTWSEWGACQDEGECQPDSTMQCGRGGTQTCGGNCQWDVACAGQSCEGPATQSCGLCGTQTRTCDMNTGEWSEWSACFGEGECSPNSMRLCGLGGSQTCGGNCRWDSRCTGQICIGANARSCNNCGVQTRTCDSNTGRWSDWSRCTGEGECAPGATRSCGSKGTQSCGNDCRWESACPGQMCQGPNTRACGNCGTQNYTCNSNTGSWEKSGGCSNEGPCKPGATDTQACDTSTKRTCDKDCQWGSCECPDNYTKCPAGCVDLMQNSNNCGGCGLACVPGRRCVAGTCQCDGSTECSGQCVNTQTSGEHCGGCNMMCMGGKTCQGGQCACPSGRTDCGSCVDLESSLTNCGGCGTICGKGQMCSGGHCICPKGQDYCDGECRDLTTSEQYCGDCQTHCGNGEICMAGKCELQCNPGETKCGGVCADLSTSSQHCGMCNRACSADQSCRASQCECTSGTQCTRNGPCLALNTNMDCGACGAACTGETSCVTQDGKSSCACGAGLSMCSSGCTNLQTDKANCGMCEKRCPGDSTCASAQCACGANQHLCGNACVAEDVHSCGADCTDCEMSKPDPNAVARCNVQGACAYRCSDGRNLCGRTSCCAATEECSRSGVCMPKPSGSGGGGGAGAGGGGGGAPGESGSGAAGAASR